MSSTDSSGNAKTDGIVIRRPRLVLLLGGVVVLLAFYIGTQVFGVLYGIVFPDKPPLPPDSREISHESKDYGVDEWVYASDQDACDVLAFYQSRADRCIIAPLQCGSDTVLDIAAPNQHVARCSGHSAFSIFAMTWEVIIATGDALSGKSQFRLSREVFWTGSVPVRPTPTP